MTILAQTATIRQQIRQLNTHYVCDLALDGKNRIKEMAAIEVNRLLNMYDDEGRKDIEMATSTRNAHADETDAKSRLSGNGNSRNQDAHGKGGGSRLGSRQLGKSIRIGFNSNSGNSSRRGVSREQRSLAAKRGWEKRRKRLP